MITASAFELVAIILLVGAWTSTLGAIAYFFRRLAGRNPDALNPAAAGKTPALPESVQPPDDTLPPSVEVFHSESLLMRDYINRESLLEVARDLGIDVDHVRIEEGRAVADSTGAAAQLSTTVDIPGFSIDTKLGGEARREELTTRTMTVERRLEFRDLMTELCRELLKREQLRIDLGYFPMSKLTELYATNALLAISTEWGLRDLPVELPPETGDPPENEAHPTRALAEANHILFQKAWSEIHAAKIEDYKTLPGGKTTFALLQSDWLVWAPEAEPDRFELWLQRLVADPARYDANLPLWLGGSSFIRVRLNPSRLEDRGRARLVPNSLVRAAVFGEITAFDFTSNVLDILPLVVFSPA